MIDKSAIVDPKAKLDKNVQIGPYCVIGPNVEIGENTIIQSHVSISGNVKIGKGNKIYPFVSINDPQDLKYAGEPTNLIIGDNNKIREYVTINPGTVGYSNVYYLSTNAMASNVTANWRAHRKGALFANPSFTQIHPTCIPVTCNLSKVSLCFLNTFALSINVS